MGKKSGVGKISNLRQRQSAKQHDADNAMKVIDDGTRSLVYWEVELDDGSKHRSHTQPTSKPEYIGLIQNLMRSASGDQAVRMATSETTFKVFGAMKMIKATVSVVVEENGFGDDFTL